MTPTIRTCGRCGDDYEAYLVLVTDDFNAISEYVRIKDEYGNVCPDCRREESPSGGYAIIDPPEREPA